MTWQSTPYTLPLALIALLSACLAVYAWRRRSVQGALAVAVVLLAMCEWCATYALEMASATLAAKEFWTHLQYLGIVVTPAAWLCFVLVYTNRGRWLSRRNLALLSLEPIATLLVHLTNGAHHWMYTGVELARAGGFWIQSISYGPWFWVHAVYSYALLLVGSLFLVQALLHSFRLYRWQASALLVAVLAPWVGNTFYLTGLSPFPNLDLTPFALAISSAALTWSLFRLRLADLVPVARAAVIESMVDGVVLLDAQKRVIYLNSAAQRWLGPRAENVVGKGPAELWRDWSELVERLRAVDGADQEMEWTPARDPRPLGVRSSLMLDWRGHLVSQVVVLRDISERKRAEEELRAGEARYRRLFEDSPISMWEVDLSAVKRSLAQAAAAGISDWPAYLTQHPERVAEALAGLRVLDVNKATLELYQADSREAFLDSGKVAIPLLSLEGVLPFLEHLMKDRSRWQGELVDRTLPNRPKHLFVTWQAFPGFDQTCEHSVISCIDVTEARLAEQERQKLEQQLRQAQKMEAIGLLAGGVAHDFNNLLTVILGNLELSLEQLPPLDATLRQQLAMAQQAGQRAATLTHQLLTFSRRQTLQVQDVDVNTLVINLSRMLGRMIGEHIEVQVVTDPHAGLVVADPSALEQILMNLVVNARDAMPPERGTGSLRVSTERVTPDRAYVERRLAAVAAEQGAATNHAPRPTAFVRLSVADTGTGMSAETQARLFEPFFTTKGPGKGTGLGLSVVYGLVRQHGGWIDVQSHVGQGTRFDVYLPAQQGLASAATEPHAHQAEAAS